MESPQNRRVPDPLPVNNHPPNQQFNYLPEDLAQRWANLQPLIPVRQRGRQRQRQPDPDPAPDPTPALSPAFVLAPAPAPDHAPPQYQYISADSAQQVAALPPLQQRGRGRGRRHDNPAPAPAPVNFEEIEKFLSNMLLFLMYVLF